MILTGVLINAAAVAAGGVLGTLGGRLMPEKMKQTVLAATGLVSIGIGLNVLGVTKLRILNMTPALLLPVLLCKFM
mgnify:CR=1 FL=1